MIEGDKPANPSSWRAVGPWRADYQLAVADRRATGSDQSDRELREAKALVEIWKAKAELAARALVTANDLVMHWHTHPGGHPMPTGWRIFQGTCGLPTEATEENRPHQHPRHDRERTCTVADEKNGVTEATDTPCKSHGPNWSCSWCVPGKDVCPRHPLTGNEAAPGEDEAEATKLLEYLAGDLHRGKFVTGMQAVLRYASKIRGTAPSSSKVEPSKDWPTRMRRKAALFYQKRLTGIYDDWIECGVDHEEQIDEDVKDLFTLLIDVWRESADEAGKAGGGT